MIGGKIEVYLGHTEPAQKDRLLWLKPYLDKDGYEILYYGVNGWTSLIAECDTPKWIKINR